MASRNPPAPRSAAYMNDAHHFMGGFGAFMTIKLRQGLGLGLIGAAAFISFACLSYNPGDPSMNTAATEHAHNWMGPLGATWADVVLQNVGFGIIPLIVAMIVYGRQLIQAEFEMPSHIAMRVGAVTVVWVYTATLFGRRDWHDGTKHTCHVGATLCGTVGTCADCGRDVLSLVYRPVRRRGDSPTWRGCARDCGRIGCV